MSLKKQLELKSIKPVIAWAFLDKNGQIRSTSLPQEFPILRKHLYPDLIQVEIRPAKKSTTKENK
jgi:hypothetical protein